MEPTLFFSAARSGCSWFRASLALAATFFLTAIAVPTAGAQGAGSPPGRAKSGAEREVEIVAAARQAVGRGDDTGADAALRVPGGSDDVAAASVLLARRAAGVCAMLRNEQDYGRAMKVASRTLRQLEKTQESTDLERVERLYWEAFLEGTILDHRRRALELLLAAAKLAPDDDRILETAHRWAASIAEFGDNSTAEVAR